MKQIDFYIFKFFKSKLKYIIIVLYLLLLTACSPMRDCNHYFVYQGIIKSNKSFQDSMIIRFDNMGDIIFNIKDRKLEEKSIINNNGEYKVSGDFFTTCSSDKDIFKEKDSLSFEILHKGEIIKKGKFCIGKLDRQYTDSLYLTIIKLPLIQFE